MADICKITTPDGNEYDVKDIKARGVELTQAEYDALEQAGEVLPDVDYYIKNGNNPNVATASQVIYDNSHTGIDANNVQDAIDEATNMVYQRDYTNTDSNNYFRCLLSNTASSSNLIESTKKSDNLSYNPYVSRFVVKGNNVNYDGSCIIQAIKTSDPATTTVESAAISARVQSDNSSIFLEARGADSRGIWTYNGSSYEHILNVDANNNITFGTKTTESIGSIVKRYLKDYIKVKYVDESNASLTKGKKLPIYLDSGYKFLCWQSVGSSIYWVSGFPIYLSNCYANDGGGVFWNGSMPTTNGLMVRFWYYEVKDI